MACDTSSGRTIHERTRVHSSRAAAAIVRAPAALLRCGKSTGKIALTMISLLASNRG
jgi:hypothetical protein